MFARSEGRRFTAEEYLAIERASEERHELIDGEMVMMAGASRAHSLIVSNLSVEIGRRLRGGPCEFHTSDMRVKVDRDGSYVYPDLVIVCGDPALEDEVQDTLLNPTVIIEVLSPSTEGYDRGAKFARYRMLDSLRDYILIAQDRSSVELFSREGDLWRIETVHGLADSMRIPALDIEIELEEVYRRVEWPEE